jgi:5-methylcytosine-specific restriction endonuclease McrA
MLGSNVLVLNRSFLPIDVTTVRRAFAMLYLDIVRVVDEQFAMFDYETWSDLSVAEHHESVGMVNGLIRVPRVILLTSYDRLPKRQIRFSRNNIYLRDKSTCQYCHKSLPRSDLTLDHVIPRSRGGKTTWDNVVAACFRCNVKKGGHLLSEANIRLKNKPRKPRWTPISIYSIKGGHYEEWKPFLSHVDFSYWNVELQEE